MADLLFLLVLTVSVYFIGLGVGYVLFSRRWEDPDGER